METRLSPWWVRVMSWNFDHIDRHTRISIGNPWKVKQEPFFYQKLLGDLISAENAKTRVRALSPPHQRDRHCAEPIVMKFLSHRPLNDSAHIQQNARDFWAKFDPNGRPRMLFGPSRVGSEQNPDLVRAKSEPKKKNGRGHLLRRFSMIDDGLMR